jgi:[acyl-carrier-protein] S-malonyltransferase
MAKDILEQFPSAQLLFEEAEDATRLPIRQLCNEGPEDKLQLTENQQPCILTLSIAMYEVLKKEAGFHAGLFAGHSLGEYSALVASGKLTLWDAVLLVKLRGKAMQEAVPEGKGAMAAVLLCEEQVLMDICKSVSENSNGTVEVVNFNSPAQQIISGSKKEVLQVVDQLASQKIRAKLLPVSAPFHSSLMTPAKNKMAPILNDVAIKDTPLPVIANLTGSIEQPYKIELLIEQIDHPVLWTKTIETALDFSCDAFVEVGPGSVLSGLVKRTLPANVALINCSKLTDAVKEITKRKL